VPTRGHSPEPLLARSLPLGHKWSKDFTETGKKRLAGDTIRQANTSEVTDLRRAARDLREVVAEQALKLRLLKKGMLGDGEDLG
jgi:transposase